MKDVIVIQNVDRVIRPKDYETLGEKIRVTSIFRTIQGEGPYTGYPSVFVRLSGCNFGNKAEDSACRWCDTAFQFDQGYDYTAEELLAAVQNQPDFHASDVVVITGGEPTLQHNLLKFMKLCHENDLSMQIETNGTQPSFYQQIEELDEEGTLPYTFVAKGTGVLHVVSPKAIYKAGKIPQPSQHVLKATACLKFVVSSDPESPHHEVPEWSRSARNKFRSIPVYVSPMAVYKRAYAGEVSSIWDRDLIDQERTAANYAYAAQYAMANGFLLSLQTHLFTSIP
ncbi:7-cyano-7-deazaguanosine synthase [Achromobacter phage Motura]|uniref:7-cyano-7-deazaguanosine synthase n=1 Tax=Achromobacter phage Motura TaxID=2591403 RepID=A0A514CSJ1_9CAUD|nr:QueE-like radical SAM domain [Achromobacter phage Motura]QDH83436.1 7-cyano-7-deazaguanosine synthase [Achromobacter phage Motura]